MQNKLHIIIGVWGAALFGAHTAHGIVRHTSRIERYQPEKVGKLLGMHKLPKKITTQLLLTQVCVSLNIREYGDKQCDSYNRMLWNLLG